MHPTIWVIVLVVLLLVIVWLVLAYHEIMPKQDELDDLKRVRQVIQGNLDFHKKYLEEHQAELTPAQSESLEKLTKTIRQDLDENIEEIKAKVEEIVAILRKYHIKRWNF